MNLVVIVESFRSIITHTGGDLKDFHVPSLIAVGAALGKHWSIAITCSDSHAIEFCVSCQIASFPLLLLASS